MTKDEAIKIAKENKYHVLEVEIEGKPFFILDADPIDMGREHKWNGNTTIVTFIGDYWDDLKPEIIRASRIADMKDDCMNFYGKNSGTYKKIVWLNDNSTRTS